MNVVATIMSSLIAVAAAAFGASAASANVTQQLAPNGKLRAAINYGNPVLAQRDASSGELRGVTVDLARELARRLGVPVQFVPYDTAGKVSDAARQDAWDVAFLAIDPVRAADIAFTPPYVIIEGTYMVRADSALRTVPEVDRRDVRIAVGRGSAYDLFLTRTIKNAELVRAPTSDASIATFERDKLDVVAGVRQPLDQYAKSHPGFRVMADRFMAIEQAVGIPRTREQALPFVRDFIEEMKASGFVAEALARSDQKDAVVAPAVPKP